MEGLGVILGLSVTIKHFFVTYLEDLRTMKKRYFNEAGIASRMQADVKGIFTVQYPEEKIPVPEEFRFIPFLIYNEDENGKRTYLCTACGICSKVCPPQCIWIVRATDATTGRPIPQPAEYYIDVDICMNCGMCTEFCPFDAIKMDHDYELAVTNRIENNIFNREKLAKPLTYYAGIRPVNYQAEEAQKKLKENKIKA